MTSKPKILFTKLLAVFFLTGLVFPFAQPALASGYQQTETAYEIKLTDSRYLGLLRQAGDSVNLLFARDPQSRLQNIYTFKSHYGLAYLENYLQNTFVYLQPETQIQTDNIVVNDPGFNPNPLDIDKQWGLIKTGFDAAWEKTTGSKSNVVAVIDTGIDETHQDLQAINFLPGYNFIANQPIAPGSDSDDNGHGTLVTGVLGATANNGIGIVGTNWQVSVIPVKALDSTGKGDASTLAQAIVWATDHGAQFINLSVGGVGFGQDSSLSSAISYAFNKNVLIVAAAGNDEAATGQDLDQNPVFPICDDNNYNMVLGVTATDQNDLKPDFANYGKNCVDVAAPGQRILSTINFDPLTGKPAPNSYAYASGTSLAVPFVVGQAALIKTLYPTATNIQIRDRIIATADPIDNLNLSQCGGQSCRGLLGAGRIDVPDSLATAINSNFNEGDLVKVTDEDGAVYEITGGQKRLVSPFVLNQRFLGAVIKTASSSELAAFPQGAYVTPNDGTLVKLDSSPTVYIMQNGQKLPVTYQVFLQRQFSFANVNTLSFSELNSWATADFLPPVDGTLVKAAGNQTVYWVVGQVLHPVNWNFYLSRGLDIFPIMIVPDNDISGYGVGSAYIG